MYLLSGLIWLSILGSGAVLGVNIGASSPKRARICALMSTLICGALAILLYRQFDLTHPGLQFQEQVTWIDFYTIHYALGVDGLSLAFILLTILTTLVVILGTWHLIHEKMASYLALLLMTQGILIGCFAATDALFFYITWEAVLIPMLFMMGIWGSTDRARAALKFFMYTFLGSALMLISFLYLAKGTEFNFSILHFYHLKLSFTEQIWILLSFLIAFSVKVPIWPVHTWLPDAHTEAPAGGSMLLAALMLKLGGYGFIRFCLPIVPDACRLFAPYICGLALISIILVGLITLVQRDIKRLVAYSSIAHMGIVVLGIWSVVLPGVAVPPEKLVMSLHGAMLQMVAHGFSASALFLSIGILYHHFHSRSIEHYSGLAHSMPILAAFFMCFAMANVGLPGTANFVGEFLIILGVMQSSFWLSVAAATTLILSAAYTLYLYQSLFWGKPAHLTSEATPLQKLEVLALSLLVGVTVLFGLWPKPLLDLIQPPLDLILTLSMHSKL